MTKTLTYPSLIIASIIVIFGFVTATTYSQLAVAIALYPIFIFLVFKLFPRSAIVKPKVDFQPPPPKLKKERDEASQPNREAVFISDIDRRAFIKLIGATGISFFLLSLLGKRLESLVFGRVGQLGTNQPGANNQLVPAQPQSPTEGYKISEIDEGPVTYYGFTGLDEGWLIMKEDSGENNFRYSKGRSDFPNNWENRENLKYDYFYNLF